MAIEKTATTAPSTLGNEPEGFIKKADVARRLQKTVRTVDNLMGRGILPFYKIGRSVAFKWSEVETHLAQKCRVSRKTEK